MSRYLLQRTEFSSERRYGRTTLLATLAISTPANTKATLSVRTVSGGLVMMAVSREDSVTKPIITSYLMGDRTVNT